MSQSTDREDLKTAIEQFHKGNLEYGNYRQIVFVTSEKQTNQLFGPWPKKLIDGRSIQSSCRTYARTLDGEKGDIVILDSGIIGLRIDNTASQYRMIDIGTASDSEFLQIHTVMRKYAPLKAESSVNPGDTRSDTDH